jgi:uncharacterized membrane protein
MPQGVRDTTRPPEPDAPSTTDPFVGIISEAVGGPLGRHAALRPAVTMASTVALVTAAVIYVLGALFHLRCRSNVVGESVDTFKWMCYSDIGLLYSGRGLQQGNTPYLDSGDYPVLEYPVLTGWFLELERLLNVALGAPSGPSLTEAEALRATNSFFLVNVVLLGALFLVAVWAQVRTTHGRPWDAVLVAASPCVAAAGLINWDMLPVALTALGCLFWARGKPGAAGLLLGLGAAAKLYPAFLLGPLLLLCLRAGRVRQLGPLLGGFAGSWLAVNLPVMLWAPDAWLSFWQFNSDRSGDLGSIWYVLSLAGHPVPNLNAVGMLLFAAACVLLGGLIVLAPRRPRFGAVAFLVVVAFLMTNKVYSPQYVLWLLPLLVLARPRCREWWIFTTGELVYFAAIWWHLGGYLAPGAGGPDRLYWLAVVVRLLTQGWVAAVVVRDALRPDHDPVRRSGTDDPAGGVLDNAADSAWVTGAQRLLTGAPRRA